MKTPTLRRALLPLFLVIAAAAARPLAAQIELKDAEIPAPEKSREMTLVCWCGHNENDEFYMAPASTTNVEVLVWSFDGPDHISQIKEMLKGYEHVFARVEGVRSCKRIQVPVNAKPPLYRVIDYDFDIKKIDWIKNPDEWFAATQETERKAIQAANLVVARDLPKSVAALREAQKDAEEINYGKSPFKPFDTGRFAWADMIDSLVLVQKAEETFKAEPGGFDEIQALVQFYYAWNNDFPNEHIRTMGFQTADVVDALMKTAKHYASVAQQRLLTKLRSGALVLTPADIERAAKEWSLGYLSTMVYMLYNAGKYAPVYGMTRDAIIVKESADLATKEAMLRDLVAWVSGNKEFAAALAPEDLRRFPGTLEHMAHKVQDSDTFVTVKQEAAEALESLKKKFADQAWDPPIDQVIGHLREGLPPADHPGGHEHSGS